MALLKRKKTPRPEIPAVDLSEKERREQIKSLEEQRTENTREIEELLLEYARISGDGSVVRGAKRQGRSPKDPSYWDKGEK